MSETIWMRSEFRAEAWDLDGGDHDETPWFQTADEARVAAIQLHGDPPYDRCAIFRREVSCPFPFETLTPPGSEVEV